MKIPPGNAAPRGIDLRRHPVAQFLIALVVVFVGIPFVEVHLSNVFAREAFRKESYFSDIAVGVISGLGATGYELALQFALQHSVRS